MNFLIGVVVLIVVFLLLGITFEQVMRLITRRRYAEPNGKLVEVNGKNVHVVEMGEGDITVVMEAGNGGNSLEWQLVQPKIAEFTHTISYDRLGYGRSDAASTPRTPDNIIGELHALLQTMNIQNPIVLMSHSFGGLYTINYAATYPDAVAGIVFADSAHPDMVKPINTEPELRRLRSNRIFRRIGLLRFILPRLLYQLDFLPDDKKREYTAFILLDSDMTLKEATKLFEKKLDVEKLDVPIAVVSRAKQDDESLWHDYQDKLVAMSDDATYTTTEKINHYVMLSEPDTLAEATQNLIERIKGIETRAS